MSDSQRKIFVLDTSVILYDFNAINNFQEHDVAIPITVLEELDGFKKGNSVLNIQAREFIRWLDRLAGRNMLSDWIPLDGATRGSFRVLTDERGPIDVSEIFGAKKPDHRILNAALGLTRAEPDRRVVLVSKDINLRLKARALDLPAEDYETVKIKDLAHLYKGKTEADVIDPEVIDRLYRDDHVPLSDVMSEPPTANHYFILRSESKSALAYYNPRLQRIERVVKSTAYGISPRNAEQTFALHAVMNPEIPLVTLSGSAGTGKTLLALAGAMELRRTVRQIFLARPIVPLSNRDIGFLPGDVQSKINPFMQPLWDNLGVIKNQFAEGDREYKKVDELVETEKLHIVPLAYIRGRSLANVIFIVDEAQNLTPHEVKTIITRAGENTKIVLTGDIFQIDTPYLDAHSNGLSYLIDRLRGNPLYAHVNLEKGERSALANLASMLL
ncbi:MAG TPA: PhoH family protein [Thermoanaerobaculia bacterium]|nr:PhoH family protein [Thermoanaerobaculia bacterium]